MCIRIHIRYVRSSLAVLLVVFFIVESKSKRLPGIAVEDMKENIRAIFIYMAAKVQIFVFFIE